MATRSLLVSEPVEQPDVATMLAKRAVVGRKLRSEKAAAGTDPLRPIFDYIKSSPALSHSLVGAGGGAAMGGLLNMARKKEDRTPFTSMATGALAGGGLGLGAGLLRSNPMSGPAISSTVDKVKQTGKDWYKSITDPEAAPATPSPPPAVEKPPAPMPPVGSQLRDKVDPSYGAAFGLGSGFGGDASPVMQAATSNPAMLGTAAAIQPFKNMGRGDALLTGLGEARGGTVPEETTKLIRGMSAAQRSRLAAKPYGLGRFNSGDVKVPVKGTGLLSRLFGTPPTQRVPRGLIRSLVSKGGGGVSSKLLGGAQAGLIGIPMVRGALQGRDAQSSAEALNKAIDDVLAARKGGMPDAAIMQKYPDAWRMAMQAAGGN